MQAYDAARFDPPAPLALVTVRSEQLGVVIHAVPMLLDTGADVSLLPGAWADRLLTLYPHPRSSYCSRRRGSLLPCRP